MFETWLCEWSDVKLSLVCRLLTQNPIANQRGISKCGPEMSAYLLKSNCQGQKPRLIVMPPSLWWWCQAQHGTPCNPLNMVRHAIYSTWCTMQSTHFFQLTMHATATLMLFPIWKGCSANASMPILRKYPEQCPISNTVPQASVNYCQQELWKGIIASISGPQWLYLYEKRSTKHTARKEPKAVCSHDKCHSWGNIPALPKTTHSRQKIPLRWVYTDGSCLTSSYI